MEGACLLQRSIELNGLCKGKGVLSSLLEDSRQMWLRSGDNGNFRG